METAYSSTPRDSSHDGTFTSLSRDTVALKSCTGTRSAVCIGPHRPGVIGGRGDGDLVAEGLEFLEVSSGLVVAVYRSCVPVRSDVGESCGWVGDPP
jgi:hypothetical protein